MARTFRNRFQFEEGWKSRSDNFKWKEDSKIFKNIFNKALRSHIKKVMSRCDFDNMIFYDKKVKNTAYWWV